MRLFITGGTGTIGSSIVPVALKDKMIDRVVIFSRDEYKQAVMERKLKDVEGADKLRYYLGDVRDLLRLEMAMEGITHVIHTAALKRVEKCESDPIEAMRTNVDGTANVIQAAMRKGVSHVCAISTDKAVNPVSLYGATKLMMEKLIFAANNLSGGKCSFSVVRQGNIFGSRGSVVEVWQKILDTGCKKLPVTDPDATRYFVTAENAALFIMGWMHNHTFGRLHYPSFLPAYRVSDLAEAIGADSFDIKGLGYYEKLHEEMFTDEEYKCINNKDNVCSKDSSMAPRLSIDELRKELSALKKR